MTQVYSFLGNRVEESNSFRMDGSEVREIHSGLALTRLLRETNRLNGPVQLELWGANEEFYKNLSRRVEETCADVKTVKHNVDVPPPGVEAILNLAVDLFEHAESNRIYFDFTRAEGAEFALFLGMKLISAFHEEVELRGWAGHKEQGKIVFASWKSILRVWNWSEYLPLLDNHLLSAPLARVINEIHADTYREESEIKSRELQKLGSVLENVSGHLRSALPIEAGLSTPAPSSEFWTRVREDFKNLHPPGEKMVSRLEEMMGQVALGPSSEEKEDVSPLTEEELERQVQIGWLLIEANHPLPAYIIGRELLVSGAIYARGGEEDRENWLDREVRDRHTDPFYRLTHWITDSELRHLLADHQVRVASLWSGLKERRNILAHAGMFSLEMKQTQLKSGIEQLWEQIENVVLQRRSLLRDLKKFPFQGSAVLLPVHPDATGRAVRVFESLQASDYFLLTPRGTPVPDEMRSSPDQDARIHVINCPRSLHPYNHPESYWENWRTELLQQEQVTVILNGGTEPANFLAREFVGFFSHFGIPMNTRAWTEQEDTMTLKSVNTSPERSRSELRDIFRSADSG